MGKHYINTVCYMDDVVADREDNLLKTIYWFTKSVFTIYIK